MTSSSVSLNVFRHDTFNAPDTDVSVLSDRRYPHLCKKNTSFVTGKSQNHGEIKHETMFHALDPAKAAALPAFRVSSGAGNTGCFSGKGKALMKIAILISALYKYYYYYYYY